MNERAIDSLTMEDLTEDQQVVAELIGFDNYKKLAEVFVSDVIYLPKFKNKERKIRNQKIIEEFDGTNTLELAKKYGLTMVTIRSIVAVKRRALKANPLQDAQLTLYDFE
ncbi:MAG: DNA-binding protein [Oscillospiraceae bacterium]|nr:DNA-binding protein [Oscillospiraceae bacterium]